MAIVKVDPQIEARPTLAPGTYGEDGSAKLEAFDIRPARWDPGVDVAHFEVVVRSQDIGFVRVFSDKDMRQGSQVPRLLAQLGISRDEQKAGFDESQLVGLKVVVDVGIRTYTRDGEEVTTNTIRNIHKLE